MSKGHLSFALLLMTSCAGNSVSFSTNLPSIVGSQSPAPLSQAISADNLTGLPAVSLDDYANMWEITLDQEPNVISSASSAGYVYEAPEPTARLYGATLLPATTDVNQNLGNSSLMGALATLADRLPTFLQSGIRYVSKNPDGSHNYVVRLFGPTPEFSVFAVLWVPVDDRLPKLPDGESFVASGPVLWPALYEKAFAKLLSVTHQGDNASTSATGYDTQNYGCCTTGLAGVTGMTVTSQANAGNADANTLAVRAAVSNDLSYVNSATVVMGSYVVQFNDIISWPDFNTTTQSVTLAGGSTLTAAPNMTNVMYTSTVSSEVELVANMEYSVLATNNGYVLLRNTWGHSSQNAQGYTWMRQDDFLRIFTNAYIVSDAAHTLGTAAAPDVP